MSAKRYLSTGYNYSTLSLFWWLMLVICFSLEIAGIRYLQWEFSFIYH